MTGLPSSLVDFGTAIRMLADSQQDVTELVTKFDQLVNTTEPMTVTIELTSGQVTVDNLAKIRSDLQKSLANSTPTVQNMTVITADGKQKTYVSPKDISGRKFLDMVDAFNPAVGYAGYCVGTRNTMRTVVMADSDEVSASMVDLPEVLLAGIRWNEGDTPYTSLKLNLLPFPADDKRYISNRMYYTTMTVVNRLNAPFIMTIANATTPREDIIPANGSIQYLLFSGPNMEAPNVVVMNKYGGV